MDEQFGQHYIDLADKKISTFSKCT